MMVKFITPPKEIEAEMMAATYWHIKHNHHHPEYWDPTTTIEESLNFNDRNAPPKKMIDATKMPLTYVAQMVADWTAMDEEKNKKDLGNAKNWADKNINIRWSFSPTQVEFIYKLINLIK